MIIPIFTHMESISNAARPWSNSRGMNSSRLFIARSIIFVSIFAKLWLPKSRELPGDAGPVIFCA